MIVSNQDCVIVSYDGFFFHAKQSQNLVLFNKMVVEFWKGLENTRFWDWLGKKTKKHPVL